VGRGQGYADPVARHPAALVNGRFTYMGIGTSILLIAIGAILRFAVSAHASGFSIHTVGLILIVVGIVGLVISLFLSTLWAERTRGGYVGRRRRDVY
jgi:heme/copper-type cytochrome/quinol oxidase subunit 2